MTDVNSIQVPQVNSLPPAPLRSEAGNTFAVKAEAFVAALPQFRIGMIALESVMRQLALIAQEEAAAAANSATAAANSATAAGSAKAAAESAKTAAASSATAAGTAKTAAEAAKTAAATSATNAANSATTAAAVGTIIFYPKSTLPTGFLKANGAAVSRTTYAALYAVIGTTFGAGDGSTTFNLPDLRGEFLRGWDDARGVDSGRVFGSVQTDAIKSHVHSTLRAADTGGSGLYPVTTTMGATSPIAGGDTGANAAANAETRPRNVALLACIRY